MPDARLSRTSASAVASVSCEVMARLISSARLACGTISESRCFIAGSTMRRPDSTVIITGQLDFSSTTLAASLQPCGCIHSW